MKRFFFSTMFAVASVLLITGISQAVTFSNYLDYIQSGVCRVETIEFDIPELGLYVGTAHLVYSGNKLQQIRFDWFGDGTIDRVDYYHYDAAGRLLKVELDAIINDIEYYFYDGAGRISRVEHDMRFDGKIDLIKTFLYSADGRLDTIEITKQVGSKSIIFKKAAYTYDGAGRLTEIYSYDWDEGIDHGELSHLDYFSYSPDGRVTKIETDDIVEGHTLIRLFVWNCDPDTGTPPDQDPPIGDDPLPGNGDSKKKSSSSSCFLQTLF